MTADEVQAVARHQRYGYRYAQMRHREEPAPEA